jgi:hypothetical protein
VFIRKGANMSELDKARAELWAHMGLPKYQWNNEYIKEQQKLVNKLQEQHRFKYYGGKRA